MNTLLMLLVIGFAVALFSQIIVRRNVRRLCKEGLWPKQDEAITDSHLERLVRKGENIAAIKLYRQKNSVGLVEAKQAICRISSTAENRT